MEGMDSERIREARNSLKMKKIFWSIALMELMLLILFTSVVRSFHIETLMA